MYVGPDQEVIPSKRVSCQEGEGLTNKGGWLSSPKAAWGPGHTSTHSHPHERSLFPSQMTEGNLEAGGLL